MAEILKNRYDHNFIADGPISMKSGSQCRMMTRRWR